MGIGYLLLYVALTVVALWLVAELLLQNRAPLHWRALALVGFLCVVAGMRLQSVLVIGAGAATFAVGQTFVTLAVKRGRPAGWSLRRPDGSLPGPLARVPLLAAATGGAAAVAAAETVAAVGEVGPVEVEETTAPFAYEQFQELGPDEGVYTEEPVAYQQAQPEQQYYQDGYQQTGYGDQQWQQQPAFAYDQSYGQSYDQSYAQQPYQQQYQDPYAQPQYQDPYAAQQQPAQSWEYQQQPYPGIPPQPAAEYQPQPWDYQQQG
ncbi:hypothetical protein OG871_11510 [Kitasatospora sp. NBC_00374]|uniref:hypothetical protein n=1 Tax=Kitasatospora sp. NBC_00374 TaxID=2975964 RepID=UPI003246D2B5